MESSDEDDFSSRCGAETLNREKKRFKKSHVVNESLKNGNARADATEEHVPNIEFLKTMKSNNTYPGLSEGDKVGQMRKSFFVSN